MEHVFADTTFARTDLDKAKWVRGEYDHCTFRHVDLQGADFSTCLFIDCVFEDCDLSLVKLHNTVFRDVQFRHSKILGVHFENCNKFGLAFTFDHCVLRHSSFYRASLPGTVFAHVQLVDTDFTGSDLTSCLFDHCDLTGARFEQTILEKANLRTAYGYTINPNVNRIKKARFSTSGLAGLLQPYDIVIE